MLNDKHKEKLAELGHTANVWFTAHPREAGETYLQHLWFSLRLGARIFYAGTCLLIHGLFPAFCTYAASSQLSKIHSILQKRLATLAERHETH